MREVMEIGSEEAMGYRFETHGLRVRKVYADLYWWARVDTYSARRVLYLAQKHAMCVKCYVRVGSKCKNQFQR